MGLFPGSPLFPLSSMCLQVILSDADVIVGDFHLTVFVVVKLSCILPSDIITSVHHLSEICHDVKIEHYLQPLTGENLEYRTDCSHLCHYVLVFNSLAPSNKSSTLSAAYHKRSAMHKVHEMEHG